MSRSKLSNLRLRNDRNGLSLLEVMLAIALLGTSMVVIYQLMGIGYRSAMEAQLQSDAANLVDTKMAEVSAGVLPLENAGGVPIEEAPEWNYSVEVESSDQIGLLRVIVSVERNDEVEMEGITVVRFMPDPDYDPYALEEN
jgi:type II secretion system protein I